MRRAVAAVALGVGLVLAPVSLAGCGSTATVTGELVSKEYEGRNCERKVGTKCKRWDPAEHELTIVREDGSEVELVVSKPVYDKAVVGTTGTWKGRID